jgi:hypothetical protein
VAGVTVATASTTAAEYAVAFLTRVLAAGRLPATKVATLAHDAGISPRTLRRAREKLRVRTRQGATGWSWSLNRSDDQAKAGGQDGRKVVNRAGATPAPIVAADSLFATRAQLDRISHASARAGLSVSMAAYRRVTGREIGTLKTVTSREAEAWIAELDKRVPR